MMDPAEADRRTERLEKELADLQEETTLRQLEANLTRDALKATLGTAAVIAQAARNVIENLAAGFSAGVERMADDLNGHDHR